MAGHGPILGLRRPLADVDRAAQLPASVGPGGADRSAAHPPRSQIASRFFAQRPRDCTNNDR
jgi:hypothetical protein